MEHVSAGEATRARLNGRRHLMREQARAQHPIAVPLPQPTRYETPAWLDRSFVLPLTPPETRTSAHDLPAQSVPSHDDDPVAEAPVDEATFVRPPSDHVDFARVVRRHDLHRAATRLHWGATGLAGLALVAYLLVDGAPLLVAVAGLGILAVGGFVARMTLSKAPVPHVQR